MTASFPKEFLEVVKEERLFNSPSNVAILRGLVEGEGMVFEDFIGHSFDECVERAMIALDKDVDTICLLSPELLRRLYKKEFPLPIDCLCKVKNGTIFMLFNNLTPVSVRKWLRIDDKYECIICFEDFTQYDAVQHGCHNCGSHTCYKCRLDVMQLNDESGDLYFQCPNCRHYETGLVCFSRILFMPLFLETPAAFAKLGLNNAQKRLVCKWTGYGGFGDMAPLRHVLFSYFAQTDNDFKTRRRQNEKLKREIMASNRRLEQLDASVSATIEPTNESERKSAVSDSVIYKHFAAKENILALARSYASDQCRHRCAYCGKGFWDKKAKKKAPKCGKCKRVSYCNAKCRKYHRKTHDTLHCGKSVAKPKMPKAKRSAAAEPSCRPY